MADLTIGGRAVEATVVKLRAGAEGKALSDMTRDGRNNVAFKIDGDTYVASGHDLAVKGVAEWATVKLGGAGGHVVKVDDEVMKPGWWKRWGLAGGAVGLVGMPASGLALGALFGAMPSVLEFAAYGGIGAVLFGGAALAWGGLTKWWNGKQAGRDVLGKYADPA